MKRAMLILSAVVAAGLPLGGLAVARDRDDGGQGRGRARQEQPMRRDEAPRYERQRQRQDARREEGRREEGRRDEGRRYEAPRYEPRRGPPVRSFREDGDRGGGRRWDDRRYDDQGPSTARRGGYLPDSYRGEVVEDYQRHRLRTPPRGYAWVRVGGGYALVGMNDGRIYDMVE